MAKTKCTPAVYVIYGSKALRVGESQCLERRIPEVLRKQGDWIGEVKDIRYIPEANRARRRKIERDLIDKLMPYCNPIRR